MPDKPFEATHEITRNDDPPFQVMLVGEEAFTREQWEEVGPAEWTRPAGSKMWFFRGETVGGRLEVRRLDVPPGE